MLSKREKDVMSTLVLLCKKQGRCLISPEELKKLVSAREKWTADELEKTLSSLETDGFFELLSTDRKGEKMYVVIMKKKGYFYKRENVRFRRDGVGRILWAVASAVAAFIVGLILKRIF